MLLKWHIKESMNNDQKSIQKQHQKKNYEYRLRIKKVEYLFQLKS